MLHEQTIDGFRVLFLGPTSLVASERTAGAWYVVDPDSGCTCPDRAYRGRACKHMRVAALAAELDRCQAVAVEAVTPASTRRFDLDAAMRDRLGD